MRVWWLWFGVVVSFRLVVHCLQYLMNYLHDTVDQNSQFSLARAGSISIISSLNKLNAAAEQKRSSLGKAAAALSSGRRGSPGK
jgi:hypothetical protein